MVGRRAAVWGVATWVMLSGAAYADDTPAPGATSTANAGSAAGSTGEWGGLYNGRTLGSGGGAVIAQGGWPDIGAGALFGIASGIDLGVVAAGEYNPNAPETDVQTFGFGLDLRAVARFKIIEGDTVSALARVEPGFRFAQLDPIVTGGPVVDLAFDVGIKVMTGGSIYLGLEIPTMFYALNQAVFVQIPVLPGAGFEYHVNDFIGFGARVNAGPAIDINTAVGGGTAVDFALLAQGFFIFRWDRTK